MPIQINDVFSRIKQAQAEYDSACACSDSAEKHASLRMAYGDLSQAAADAYMYFSAKPETGNFAEGGISTWARDELEVITRTIGAQYNAQGLAQTSRMQMEYPLWSERVCTFVNKLNASRRMEAGQVAARDWKEEELRRKRKQIESFEKHMVDPTGGCGLGNFG